MPATIDRSAPALVATCTPVSGLHSSSSTTSSYWYFAFGSAFRSFTASSAELRPPRPSAEFPPVRGPMNASFTVSLATAGSANSSKSSATTFRCMAPLPAGMPAVYHASLPGGPGDLTPIPRERSIGVDSAPADPAGVTYGVAAGEAARVRRREAAAGNGSGAGDDARAREASGSRHDHA